MRALTPNPVHVIGNGLDVVVDVGIEVLASLALVARALHDLIEVLDHARGRERVAVVVEVETPRIARAFSKDFKDVLCRMEAPDRAVQFLTLAVGRARLADV